MNNDLFDTMLAWALDLHQFLAIQIGALLRPWVGYQILIALALFVVAHLIGRVLKHRLRDWMRSREGWPMWRMRVLVVLSRRMRGIVFVAMIWPLVLVMQEITWPSRSFLLIIIAKLALAWLLVALATRLIANRLLRSVVWYSAWTWLTLEVLGQTENFIALLASVTLDIGTMSLSLWLMVQAAVALSALLVGARFLSRSTARRIESNEDLSPSMRVLSVKLTQLAFYSAAFFIGMRAVGLDLTGLAVLSGAIGLGLGFGLQKVVSNLVSGLIILLDKSVKPGDVISLGETFGWINSLGARYVSVVTRDGREYLIPNEDLITGQVVNWSHTNEFVRLDIFFGASYGDDPHQVRKLAIEAAKSVGRVLSDRAPVCHIVGFGDSSVDYILRFWITDPTEGLTNVRGAVFLALWDTFKANGVSIPFPQRETRILNDPAVPVQMVPGKSDP